MPRPHSCRRAAEDTNRLAMRPQECGRGTQECVRHGVMRAFFNLARALVSVTVVLLLMELSLRLTGQKFNASLYTADPIRGFALRPNSEGWVSEEGENYVRINSDGMRDREHSVSRPPDTLRIAFIGDSATEARQVPIENTFPAVTEKKLLHCRPHVETLNFAVPGYSIAQMLLTLRTRVWKYDPQIVIASLYLGNAIFYSNRTLSAAPPGGPFYRYEGERLVLDPAPLPDPGHLKTRNRLSDIMNRWRLLLLLNEAKQGLERKRHTAQASNSSALPPDYLGTWPYLPPKNRLTQDAWRVSEGLLREMRDEVRKHGAEFWIVTLDMPMQVDPAIGARESFRKRLGVDSLFYPDERIAEFAQREGIPCITLAPGLAKYATQKHVYLHGFFNTPLNKGHWNELGNLLAGERVAAELCKRSQALQRTGY